MKSIQIANRLIGNNYPPYVIAELSGNHNGNIERALNLIDLAKNSGADAVKIQTYTADTITIDHDSDEFVISGGLWDGRTLYDLYDEAHTPWEWHKELFNKAKDVGITIFSSPFDDTAVEFLEKLDTPAYKVASFELIDLPLIECMAKTGKPLIISTGMSSEVEISEALEVARTAGAKDIILLHCVSGYPVPLSEANLKMINVLRARFSVDVGLSDHTIGNIAAIAAVGVGACVIEKHFTMSRSDGGVDSAFSLEPQELSDLVAGCRGAWAALGNEEYIRSPSETQNLAFRRSLYIVKDIQEGEEFTLDNLKSIRPGYGLPPKFLVQIIGQVASCSLKRGTPLRSEHVKAR